MTAKARLELDKAFDVARKDIAGGKVARAETMHNIFDAIEAAVSSLADAVDTLDARVSH